MTNRERIEKAVNILQEIYGEDIITITDWTKAPQDGLIVDIRFRDGFHRELIFSRAWLDPNYREDQLGGHDPFNHTNDEWPDLTIITRILQYFQQLLKQYHYI